MDNQNLLVLAVADLAYSGREIFELLGIILSRADFDLQSVPLTDVVETARRRRPALIIIGHRPLLENEDDRKRWAAAGFIMGGDVIEALKSDPSTQDIPVLLHESLLDVELLAQACGADAYLRVPAYPKEFLTAIRDVIKQGARGG